MSRARRDVRNAWLHLLAAFASAGVLALLWVFPPPDAALDTIPWKIRTMIPVVLVGIVIYGIGRGVSLNLSARRRIGILDRMRQPPTARVS